VQRKDPRTHLVAFALVLAPLSILPFDEAPARPTQVQTVAASVKAKPRPTPKAAAKPRTRAVSPARTTTKRPCRNGSIVLTFDDGPTPTMTPRLVRILLRENVPATFFMVGGNVRRWPAAAKLVRDKGFTIGNHTWSHLELTRLSSLRVRGQVLKAGAELRRHGIETGRLMRPPYGAINNRVSREIRRVGLVPVLWTADSLDWSGGSAMQIAHRILAQLRPYQKNIVLQHDGVDNSAASIAAVPIVIRAARARGYCFTDLGPGGGVARIAAAQKSAYARAVDKAIAGGAKASQPEPTPAAPSPETSPEPSRPVRPGATPSPLLDLIAPVGPVQPWMALPLWAALRPLVR